jgi:hypothetical protein
MDESQKLQTSLSCSDRKTPGSPFWVQVEWARQV